MACCMAVERSKSKGPFIAALFALKALQESAQPLRHTVRLILGTDAHQQWRCMDRYLACEAAPSFSFFAYFPFSGGVCGKTSTASIVAWSGLDRADAGLWWNPGIVFQIRARYSGKKQKLLQKKLDAFGYLWLEEAGTTVVLGQMAYVCPL